MPLSKEKQTNCSKNDDMKNTAFSVAMSVYKNDHAPFFDRALESITDKQTVLPDQIVLIVDGPIPGELDDVISKYQNKYNIFDVIRLPENQGLGNALRLAVENCKNELIARMDSDDVSLPTRFEEQLTFFKRSPDTDIVGGDISEFIDQESNVVGLRCVPTTHDEIKEYMKYRCALNHVSVMYKKTAVQNAGGYLDLFWNEDYYLWIRMCEQNCKMANTGTVLVNVRTGKDMYKRRGGKKYYKSEKFLQKYMLERKMIGRATYMQNILKRWILQRCLPSRLRGFLFRKLARKKVAPKNQ